jgi:hypothetical protein
MICLDLTTERTDLSQATIEGRGGVTLRLDRLDVNTGHYYVSAGCYARGWEQLYDHLHNARDIRIWGDGTPEAVMNTPHRWEVSPL